MPTPDHGRSYTLLTVASAAAVPALSYQSYPNAAVTGLVPTLRGRDPVVVLSTDFEGSRTQGFDLRSFFFGCQSDRLAGQGNGGVTVACSLSVTGYKPRGPESDVCDRVGVRGAPPLPPRP